MHFDCAGSRKVRGWLCSVPFLSCLLAHRARFFSYVHFVSQAWDIRCILRSGTWFCVTVARHRTFFYRRLSWRGTFCTLLNRWQAWLDFGHDDDSVRQAESGWDLGQTTFLPFSTFIFRGACIVLRKSNMWSRNPLVTLCVSDHSRCGAVRILLSLAAQPLMRIGSLSLILTWLVQHYQHLVGVGSLSLWCSANFDMARATLSWLCACRIALVVARFWFFSWFSYVLVQRFIRSLEGPSMKILQEFQDAEV